MPAARRPAEPWGRATPGPPPQAGGARPRARQGGGEAAARPSPTRRRSRSTACDRAGSETRRTSSGKPMLAAALRCGMSEMSWKIIATSRFAVGNRVTSSPSISTLPDSGCSRPATTRSRLVLPLPDGPTRARISPVLHRQVDLIERNSATTMDQVTARSRTPSTTGTLPHGEIEPGSVAWRLMVKRWCSRSSCCSDGRRSCLAPLLGPATT